MYYTFFPGLSSCALQSPFESTNESLRGPKKHDLTYNFATMTAHQIQTLKNFEVVIVEDAFKDYVPKMYSRQVFYRGKTTLNISWKCEAKQWSGTKSRT